jgi:hypothetical protein
VQSLAPFPVPSYILLVTPSPVSSGSPLLAPSPVPSSVLSICNPSPEPEGLSQFGSRSDRNDNAARSGHKLDSFGPERAGSEKGEDDNVNIFMDPGGSKLKENIHNWHKL